jgi:hypothetical protein
VHASPRPPWRRASLRSSTSSPTTHYYQLEAYVLAQDLYIENNPETDLPYPETRNYVHQVLERRKDYARRYSRELGL